jgi:hypothetical protein
LTTTHLGPTPCPSCGELLDAVTSLYEEAMPSDGDVTLCFNCGHLMVFADGRPRNPTDAEMHTIAGDPRIIKAQAARARVREQKRKQQQP